LYGAARAGTHRLGLDGGTEDRLVAIAEVDRDAEVQRRFEDSFQLVGEVRVAPRGRKTARLGLATRHKTLPNALAHRPIAHEDEAPGLRKAHARCSMGRFENPIERRVVDLFPFAKVSNVASQRDRFVHGSTRVFGKRGDCFGVEEVRGQAHAWNHPGRVRTPCSRFPGFSGNRGSAWE
jgi:hypothetical protein